MAGRKGNKDCCCDACNFRPVGARVGGRGGTVIDLVEGFCCACVPKYVCAVLQCADAGGEIASGNFIAGGLGGGPGSPGCDPNTGIIWGGILGINGKNVDFDISFQVVNGVCYLCLSSYALGIPINPPYHCYVIDNAGRAAPDRFCAQLLLHQKPPEWDLSGIFPGCLSYASLKLYPADVVPIKGRQPCISPYTGLVEPDSDPIANVCQSCGCIARCACITVIYPHAGIIGQFPACRSGTNWSIAAPVPVTIGVQSDGTVNQNCQLALLTSPIASHTNPVLITSQTPNSNPCPWPIAAWDGFDSYGHVVKIKWNGMDCQGCSTIEMTQCCDGRLPRILHATLTGDATCLCANATVPLIYDETVPGWVGDYKGADEPYLLCGQDVTITLGCSGYGWILSIIANPCTGGSQFVNSQNTDCSALSLTFNVNIGGGIGCCGQSSGGHSVTVKVTE